MKALRDVFGDTLVDLANTNSKIVVLDADLANSTKADKFAATHPERFLEMGIAEQNLVGVAAGIATVGFIPWLSSFTVFFTHRAIDPIRMLVAQTNANVKIGAAYSGLLTGLTGKTHQDIQDVSSDSFLAWRAKQTFAPKTVNEYLSSISSLLNWMEKHQRIERNSLRHIQKVQSNGEQTRPRRAFTREEFQRLLAVSQSRKPVYLTAVFTGLRRSELASLEWDDVHLEAAQPFLNVRASTTKNHKQAIIGLHEDVVTELRKLQAKRRSSANSRIFAALMPSMETFKADLKEANIEFINAKNQRADFHSLRHTLATNLALSGTAPRVAMEIMRHSATYG